MVCKCLLTSLIPIVFWVSTFISNKLFVTFLVRFEIVKTGWSHRRNGLRPHTYTEHTKANKTLHHCYIKFETSWKKLFEMTNFCFVLFTPFSFLLFYIIRWQPPKKKKGTGKMWFHSIQSAPLERERDWKSLNFTFITLNKIIIVSKVYCTARMREHWTAYLAKNSYMWTSVVVHWNIRMLWFAPNEKCNNIVFVVFIALSKWKMLFKLILSRKISASSSPWQTSMTTQPHTQNIRPSHSQIYTVHRIWIRVSERVDE